MGMSKHYRPWKIDEAQLLPPSVQDYVPEKHLSRFIVALVRESLDLCEIEASYASVLGQPPFHPALMTALLLNGYVSGLYSSRAASPATRGRGLKHLLGIGILARSRGRLVKDKKITPHIPVRDKSDRDDGTFSRSDFRWDKRRGHYICLNGKVLRTSGTIHGGRTLL